MSVWECGCPGVPTYGCVTVCFFFCSYLFVSHCSNNTRHSTTYNGHSTTRPDRFADIFKYVGGHCAHPSCAVEPLLTRSRSRSACRHFREKGRLIAAADVAVERALSLGTCVACFDSTTVTGHVLPDCFMVSPSCIIVIVICSVLAHSRNTCQGAVHVQLCSLRVARRVCTRHTLFPSVHSSDLGPHLRLFKQDHVEPCLLFFCVSFFFGIFSMSKFF